jgi:hypothetical protein
MQFLGGAQQPFLGLLKQKMVLYGQIVSKYASKIQKEKPDGGRACCQEAKLT